jgi:hypothetical protein
MNDALLQSVLLPLGLALAAGWVLQRLQSRFTEAAVDGASRAWLRACRPAAAAALATGLTSGLLVGWAWPPPSLAAWLPWVAVGAAGLGIGLDLLAGSAPSVPASRSRTTPVAAGVAALGVTAGLLAAGSGPASRWVHELALAAGVVLAVVLAAPHHRPGGCVAAAVATLALGVLFAASGSLLLAQTAAALGFALGGVALAVWSRPRPEIGHAVLLLAIWGWLALALAGTRLISISTAQLALVALALLPAALLPRVLGWGSGRRRGLAKIAARPALEATLIGAATAAVAAAALAIALLGLGDAQRPAADDYYTPDWSD